MGTSPTPIPGCSACQALTRSHATPGGVIAEETGWILAHNDDTPLLGHLMLYAARHVDRPADLTPDEAASFGTFVSRADAALRGALGAEQTYVVGLTEGATHLHYHLVPIEPHVPAIGRGVGIFRFLERGEPVDPERITAFAERLRAVLQP